MLLALLASVALAQDPPAVPELNAQLFRPALDSRATLWTESAGRIVDGLTPQPRATLHYTNRPFVFVPDTGEASVLVSDVFQLDAVMATAFDRFRLALDVPVYLYSAGQLTEDGPGIGDVALDGRGTILDPEDFVVGAALGGRLVLPTSGVAAPLGAPGVVGEIYAVGEYRVDDLTLLANLGTRVGPETTMVNVAVDDQFLFRVGGGYAISESAGVSADLAGQLTYGEPLSNAAGSPVEALLGGWVRLSEEWVLRPGVGRGLTPGIGSPTLRVMTMISYEPPVVKDTDADGLVDRDDACPAEPEDFDDFRDDDGCPEIDNDGDGILDAADICPNDPEDLDDFRDDDGCPDVSHQVTVQAEDPEGRVLDAEIVVLGPQPDLTGSGSVLLDLHEGDWVARAEAPDFVAAEVAFTVPSREDTVVVVLYPDVSLGLLQLVVTGPDGVAVDGVRWSIDGRPGPAVTAGASELELTSGPHAVEVSAPGHHPATVEVEVPEDATATARVELEPARVLVTRERIDISETVYFETGKATIKEESHGLLDEVAQILLDHPEILLVRIEGHTDSRGGADFNRELSDDRAASVRTYLVEAGVAPERLSSVGYGEDRPVDPRNLPEAWEKNRRVDFFIEQREGEQSEEPAPDVDGAPKDPDESAERAGPSEEE